MTFKQGVKFDAPESVSEIPRFIAFHQLDVNEIRDRIDSFENFNSFFYRKLKEDARPAADPEDPTTLVSSADCRMTCFQSVTEATQIWIKGRTFSIAKLLGDDYKHDAKKFEGGSLCIFRLAPQDYHRYHSPVDGIIGKMSAIEGEYYTVNPIAVRSTLDIYAENARVIVPMDTEAFGRVYNVCIGAMMVGSIKFTKNEGEQIKRAEEYGYFAFGGSTIVCLFEPGRVRFDDVSRGKSAGRPAHRALTTIFAMTGSPQQLQSVHRNASPSGNANWQSCLNSVRTALVHRRERRRGNPDRKVRYPRTIRSTPIKGKSLVRIISLRALLIILGILLPPDVPVVTIRKSICIIELGKCNAAHTSHATRLQRF